MTDKNILIDDFAAQIKAKIAGGKLYGAPIDMDNPNHLLVAAWLVCEGEQLAQKDQERKILASLSN